MEKAFSKKLPSKASKKMSGPSFGGYDDDGGDYGDDLDVIATIFTMFAAGISPQIDKEIAYEICKEMLERGGIGTHNATACGKMVQRTAFGAKSNARH